MHHQLNVTKTPCRAFPAQRGMHHVLMGLGDSFQTCDFVMFGDIYTPLCRAAIYHVFDHETRRKKKKASVLLHVMIQC